MAVAGALLSALVVILAPNAAPLVVVLVFAALALWVAIGEPRMAPRGPASPAPTAEARRLERLAAGRALSSGLVQGTIAPTPTVATELLIMARGADPGLRACALPAVPAAWAVAAPETRAELVSTIMELVAGEDPTAAWLAARSLAAIAPHLERGERGHIVEELTGLLTGGAEDIQCRALRAIQAVDASLTQMERASVCGHLVTLASAPSAPVRMAAIATLADASRTLEEPGRGAAAAAVGKLARGPASAEQVVARAALGEGEALLEMTGLFCDPDGRVRREAMHLLVRALSSAPEVTRRSVFKRLLELHAHEERTVRLDASAVVKACKEHLPEDLKGPAVDELVALLGHKDEHVRRLSTVTMVGIADVVPLDARAKLVAGLRALTADPEPLVADQARDSLIAIGEREVPTSPPPATRSGRWRIGRARARSARASRRS